MKDIAIKVDNVSKTFRLPIEKKSSLKSLFVNLWRGKKGYEEFVALKNVSIEVYKGEFFGVVGRNGSGKSTLLKLMAGIYTPTKGHMIVNGKLTPFIELGVGFSPDLTGRENVYLNGALLGFSRKAMLAMYDDIVSFAELQRFMDQKLKNYSSGMQVRLAFSIAIRAQSPILILDEVLAVGDEAFQKKCFDYFDNLKKIKQTVVIVTHDMASVERFCNRAMLVENGEIKLIGKPYEVASAYSRINDDRYEVEPLKSKEDKENTKKSQLSIKLKDNNGKESTKFTSGDEMTVELSWTAKNVKNVGVAIVKQDGVFIYGPNTYQDKYNIKGKDTVSYKVVLNLGEGRYFIKAGLFGNTDVMRIDFEEQGPSFAVTRNKEDNRWGGVVKLDHEWV
jgi:ABC-2 type transport system ATP-binding protein